MKKTIKLWAIALALWMFATAFITTSNEVNASKIASVHLNEWLNVDCTLDDYVWTWLTVSAQAQHLTGITNNVVCVFWKNAAKQVDIALDDLQWVNTSMIMWSWLFTGEFNVTTLLVNGSLLTTEATNASNQNMGDVHTIYNKSANKIWTYTWSVTLEWTVPAGTAADTYSGAINITSLQ